MRHPPRHASLVIEQMTKQFITHILAPFLEAYKEILDVCGPHLSGRDGVKADEKLLEQMGSHKAAFVTCPSGLRRG